MVAVPTMTLPPVGRSTANTVTGVMNKEEESNIAANLRNALDADEDKTELDTLARKWAKELLRNATTKLKKRAKALKTNSKTQGKGSRTRGKHTSPAIIKLLLTL